MKNFKNFLDKKLGKSIHKIQVTVVSPYDSSKRRLSFDLEIKSAHLTDDGFELNLYISNKLLDGFEDDHEFNYLFSRGKFQEAIKEDTYDFFNIKIFGIDLKNFSINFFNK